MKNTTKKIILFIVGVAILVSVPFASNEYVAGGLILAWLALGFYAVISGLF